MIKARIEYIPDNHELKMEIRIPVTKAQMESRSLQQVIKKALRQTIDELDFYPKVIIDLSEYDMASPGEKK